MVHALRRARQWVTPEGCVIDVHPTAIPARLEIGEQPIGELDAGDASERHANATAALTVVLNEGLFGVSAAVEFVYSTYGDSVDELRDFIADKWRSTRIGSEIAEAARVRLRADPAAGRPRVVEQVRLTTLHVLRRGQEPSDGARRVRR
jgi:hypothetical protein